MADVQVKNFRPTGLLRIEESMGADSRLPEVEGFVPNGLLGCHLTDDTSLASSSQDTPTHITLVTPSSPFRQNGLLYTSRTESGAYRL
jgi:hypothetical protein